MTDQAETPAFAIGDAVEKYTGDYQLPGEVRAVFTTRAGKIRYVVEHHPGFLHIYSGSNLRALHNMSHGLVYPRSPTTGNGDEP
jgi:hypothetical protein